MYLDPGFGGMLVQVIVAVIAMGGILVFSLRKKIRALFTKNKNTGSSDAGSINRADTNAGTSDDKDAIDMLSDD